MLLFPWVVGLIWIRNGAPIWIQTTYVNFKQRSRTHRRSFHECRASRSALDTSLLFVWSSTAWLVNIKMRPISSFSDWIVMAGTGIFNSASVIFTNTQSIGISLLLFGSGGIIALAGVIIYMELGLTIPRWPFGPNGEKISTPRSGDNLNYVCAHSTVTSYLGWG